MKYALYPSNKFLQPLPTETLDWVRKPFIK